MAVKNSNKKERFEAILNHVHENGCYNLPVKELAEQFQVSERQIYWDAEHVFTRIQNPKMEIISKKLMPRPSI